MAVAFFAVSNVCNAQQFNNVDDKLNATEQVSDKDEAPANDKFCTENNDKESLRHHVMAMPGSHMRGMHHGRGFRHHRGGFPTASMAMSTRNAFMAMPAHNALAMQPVNTMSFRITELSEEELAKMSKKDRRDYKKAVKHARQEMKQAQEQIRLVQEQTEASLEEKLNVAQEILHSMHIAKRYTQKANRIAYNQRA
ncbi:MAG: hypothetical protein MJZ60_03565 [Bacteroidaceae bacterium]|nr:hypothetical protein [Bacteroidaceae bacterium]